MVRGFVLPVFRSLLVVATMSGPLLAQEAAKPKPRPSYNEVIKMHTVLRLPDMGKAQVQRDVVYKTAEGQPLRLDVYAPPDAKKDAKLPAVVFVSGASETRSWQVYQDYGQLTAAHRMVAVMYDKRYGPDQYDEGTADTRDLLAYLRGHATALRIDPDRICLWAFSAGGPLLVVGMGGDTPYLRCLAAFYPVLDVARMPGAKAPPATTPLSLVQKSPEKLVRPLFLARAGLDAPELNAAVDAFVAEALKHNLPLTLANHPRGNHAFDILDDNETSRDVIRAAFTFLAAQLR
jgi:acetyl esterase/lipase